MSLVSIGVRLGCKGVAEAPPSFSPDKNPGGKNLQERFARLGVINQILRSPERRERYNVRSALHNQSHQPLVFALGVVNSVDLAQFFYKNGVPKWRGTGYYYARYRPTLSHTLFFLMLVTSLFHLLVLRLNYGRDKRRVEYFQRSALALSGNGSGKREKFLSPDEGAEEGEEVYGRRVKVPMVEGSEMAGFLDLVVVNDHVYVVSAD